MSAVLFGFVATLLFSLGGKDQMLVARVGERVGAGVLFAGILAALLSAVALAWAGNAIAAILPPGGRAMLVGIALLLAALELFWPVTRQGPREPTHSLFAAFVVILARQIGDGARFAIFALAAWTSLPWLTALGGAIGAAAALTFGWLAGRELDRLPLSTIRRGLGGITIIAAIAIGLSVRGIV